MLHRAKAAIYTCTDKASKNVQSNEHSTVFLTKWARMAGVRLGLQPIPKMGLVSPRPGSFAALYVNAGNDLRCNWICDAIAADGPPFACIALSSVHSCISVT